MRRKTRNSWYVIAAALLCTVPAAFAACPGSAAQGTACMDLVNPGNNIMDNVYVGPYYASINGGVPTAVICDDFSDDSYVPETWTADIYNTPNYGTTPANETRDAQKWTALNAITPQTYSVAQDYNMVGWLATEMLNNLSNPTTEGELHFALWAVFDPSALPYLDSNSLSWLSQATAFKNDSSYISSFTIYSPDLTQPISAPGSATNPPQEFLVHTPEPPVLAVLGLDLSGLAGLVFLLRRRVRQF